MIEVNKSVNNKTSEFYKTSSYTMNSEEAAQFLGRYSRWQILIMTVVGVAHLITAPAIVNSIIFLGLEAEHHCNVPEGITIKDAIPSRQDGSMEQCLHFENYTATSNIVEEGCPLGWDISTEGANSIVNEWNLVCDTEIWVSIAQLVYIAGNIVGTIVVSALGDKFGRHRIICMSMFLLTVIQVANAFTTDIIGFTVARFFIGLVQPGVVGVLYVYCAELFPSTHRTYPGMLLQNFYTMGCLYLVFVAYFVRVWSWLLIALALPGLIVVPIYLLLINRIMQQTAEVPR